MSADELERTGREESLRSLTRDVHQLRENQSQIRLHLWIVGVAVVLLAVGVGVLIARG